MVHVVASNSQQVSGGESFTQNYPGETGLGEIGLREVAELAIV